MAIGLLLKAVGRVKTLLEAVAVRSMRRSGAGWVCGYEGCNEEGRESEGGCDGRLPDGRYDIGRRYAGCSSILRAEEKCWHF